MRVIMGVDFQVTEGERHAIIGPNGAGKTTFFNLITGTYKPRGGKVLFKNKDVTGAAPHQLVRKGMGRSFQITSTFERLTAFQNIRMAVLSKRGIRFNLFRFVDKMDEVTRETEEILKRINLDGERDIPASGLSYGKSESRDQHGPCHRPGPGHAGRTHSRHVRG